MAFPKIKQVRAFVVRGADDHDQDDVLGTLMAEIGAGNGVTGFAACGEPAYIQDGPR